MIERFTRLVVRLATLASATMASMSVQAALPTADAVAAVAAETPRLSYNLAALGEPGPTSGRQVPQQPKSKINSIDTVPHFRVVVTDPAFEVQSEAPEVLREVQIGRLKQLCQQGGIDLFRQYRETTRKDMREAIIDCLAANSNEITILSQTPLVIGHDKALAWRSRQTDFTPMNQTELADALQKPNGWSVIVGPVKSFAADEGHTLKIVQQVQIDRSVRRYTYGVWPSMEKFLKANMPAKSQIFQYVGRPVELIDEPMKMTSTSGFGLPLDAALIIRSHGIGQGGPWKAYKKPGRKSNKWKKRLRFAGVKNARPTQIRKVQQLKPAR